MSWLLPLLTGLATGVLSAWGVGGGTLLLLCMTLFLGVGHRTAQAINLLFFLPTAASGLVLHKKNGYIDAPAWKQATLPAVLAAGLAAWAAIQIDVSLLRRPFGLFLLYTGASTLWKAWKEHKKKSAAE